MDGLSEDDFGRRVKFGPLERLMGRGWEAIHMRYSGDTGQLSSVSGWRAIGLHFSTEGTVY